MHSIVVPTSRKDEVVDLTESIAEYLRRAEKESGVCVAFAAHTTCALTTADLDPGTDEDLLQALRKLLPQLTLLCGAQAHWLIAPFCWLW